MKKITIFYKKPYEGLAIETLTAEDITFGMVLCNIIIKEEKNLVFIPIVDIQRIVVEEIKDA